MNPSDRHTTANGLPRLREKTFPCRHALALLAAFAGSATLAGYIRPDDSGNARAMENAGASGGARPQFALPRVAGRRGYHGNRAIGLSV